MAAVAPPAHQAADLMQKLFLDSKTKGMEIPEATKKPSVDSSNLAHGQSDTSVTPILPEYADPATMSYHQSWYPTGYYYGSYDANGAESDDYKKYVTPDGVEMNSGAYGDNGSLMYHHGYGYAPYGPYSPATTPVPTLGQDGQTYGAQHYHYLNMYLQSMPPTSGVYTNPVVPAKGEITSVAGDQMPLSVDSKSSKSNGIANGGVAKGNNGMNSVRTAYQNSSYSVNGSNGRGAVPSSYYQDPRWGFDGVQSLIPWYENPYFTDGYSRPLTSSQMTSAIASGNGVASSKNQNFQPHLMGYHPRSFTGMNTANGYMNGMYSNKLYGQYGNAYKSGMGCGSNCYNPRMNGRWMSVDSKYKPRGRGYGFYGYCNESMDGLNELNKGPRTKSSKSLKEFVPVALAVKGQNIPISVITDDEKLKLSATPDREQYNKPDMPETYPDAMFFIIKSYSEDDVHKSIKYNVWSSTPNGNKKLDATYSVAQQKSGGCPVFLFFSVNTSGQFVGVAEMVGPVDFEKNVEYWQQDKWVGCFPVKWHIVKDLPNSMLKHIILENNENKPVTNSRDTQEVKLDQGLEVLKIFKDYTSRQCILDDFDFYEDRQKRIQEKKAKQQQYQKQAQQVWEGKTAEEKSKGSKVSADGGDVKPDNSPGVASNLDKDTTSPVEAVPEKILVVCNGVANAC